MAMMANPNLLAEIYLDNRRNAQWVKKNRFFLLNENFQDDLLLEALNFEDYYRNNKPLVDHFHNIMIKEYGMSDSQVDYFRNLNESMWKDLAVDAGIALGSLIPGVGSAVATGGVIYYIARAFDANRRGQHFTTFFELLSAIMTAPAIAPAIGTALSSLGKSIIAPLKPLFELLKAGGTWAKDFFNIFKWFGKGAAAEGKVAAEASAKAIKTIATENKLITTTLSKLDGPLLKLEEMLASDSKVWKAVGEKFPGMIEKMIDGVKALRGTGKILEDVAKAEGPEVLEAIAKNPEAVESMGKAVGNEALQAEAAALKTRKSAIVKKLGDTSKELADEKIARVVAKGEVEVGEEAAKQASRLAGEAGEAAAKLEKELIDTIGSQAEFTSKINRETMELLARSGTESAEIATKELTEAFSKLGKDELVEVLNRTKDPNFIINLQTAATEAVGGTGTKLGAHLDSLYPKDFVSYFADQFTKNGSKISMTNVVTKGEVIGFEIMGSNGAKMIFSPRDITMLFGPSDTAKLFMNIYGNAGKEALENAAKVAAEELLTSKQSLQAIEASISSLTKSKEGLRAALRTVQKELNEITPKIVEEVVTSPEVQETVAKNIAEAGADASSKVVQDIVEETFAFSIKQKLMAITAARVTQELESTDIQSYQQSYGTADDQRLTTGERERAQGIQESKKVNQLIRNTRKRTAQIRTFKLEKLIN